MVNFNKKILLYSLITLAFIGFFKSENNATYTSNNYDVCHFINDNISSIVATYKLNKTDEKEYLKLNVNQKSLNHSFFKFSRTVGSSDINYDNPKTWITENNQTGYSQNKNKTSGRSPPCIS